MVEKIFICNIISRDKNLEQTLIDTEIIVNYAESLEEAFGKLIVYKNYSNTRIIDLKEDRLLAQVEVEDLNSIRYILIGLPTEILPRIE